MLLHDYEDNSRLIAKLVREVLSTGPFETLADLTDAVKTRCARLRIPCTADDVSTAYRVIGSNRELVTESEQRIVALRRGEPDPLSVSRNEAGHIWKALLRRRQVEQASHGVEPERHGPFGELETEIITRLSALSEDAAVAYFWTLVQWTDDRLGLLLVLGHVVIERPASWDQTAVRRDHLSAWAGHSSVPPCFACASLEPVYLHHVIEVQHGGSNGRRNQVPLCFRCHQYLHPWLKTPRVSSRSGFESLASIAGIRR